MKTIMFFFLFMVLATSCSKHIDKDAVKKEIYRTEKAFEKMTHEKGIAEAFYFYADPEAVIKRENDTLIKGKENIKVYYNSKNLKNATVDWTPDYIDVSDCGTLGYTYGKYVWKTENKDGVITEHKGVFHTVWKKQKDNTWRYVWD